MIDPIIKRAVEDANKRSPRILSSSSFLKDEEWDQAIKLVRKEGPLSVAERIRYRSELERFARSHFLSLVFECERLYEVVRHQAKTIEKLTPQGDEDKK